MKEATGELNMTVVTVVIIAALAGIGSLVVLPAIQNGLKNNSKCSAAACGVCTGTSGQKGTASCVYYETKADGTTDTQTIQCPCNVP